MTSRIRPLIHMTTVHSRTDTRIAIKQAATLAEWLSPSMLLYVQDGQGDADLGTYRIVDTGPRPAGRLRRMTLGAWRMYRAVRAAKPDVVHFHDPELIPIGMLLRLEGVRVVYDVHEDLPRQIANKSYIPGVFRALIAVVAEFFEWLSGSIFNGIVPATSAIAKRFPAGRTVLVQNFPVPEELVLPTQLPYAERPLGFVYIGGLTRIRGTSNMIEAIDLVSKPKAKLHLGGNFSPAVHESECRNIGGWSRVVYHGWVGRSTVATLLGNVRAGIIVSHSLPRHVVALPTKMFEYMAAGLPVIVSDFPILRSIVQTGNCGLLVDPEDPNAIARAMDWILDNPAEAERMGQRGQRLVETTYNWPTEARRLIGFYNERLGVPLKPEKREIIE